MNGEQRMANRDQRTVPLRIPVLLLIDCEPDPRLTVPGRPDRWIGFERLFALVSGWRAALVARTGSPVRVAWFWRLDPQIEITYGSADWAVRAYAAERAEAHRAGDEAGLHVHAWRWDTPSGHWVADHADKRWVEECLRGSFAAFETAFDRPCRLVRFGDGFIDEAVLGLAERLGAEIDLTVEPGCAAKSFQVEGEPFSGTIPDRHTAPRKPYRPSPHDFCQPDPGAVSTLWELPVSCGPVSVPRPSLRRPRHLGAWLAAPRREVKPLDLGLPPADFQRVFDASVSSPDAPYAAIVVRTSSAADQAQVRNVKVNLNGLAAHRLLARFEFTSPTHALQMLVA